MHKVQIRHISEKNYQWITGVLKERWGSVKIVSRGKITSANKLPGFITYFNNQPVWLITYSILNDECEIISLDSLQKSLGIGSSLLKEVVNEAKRQKLKRVWLVTTNDNIYAQQFYIKQGFKLVAIHKNALEKSRQLKPGIPMLSKEGIPIKDEIEMEIELF